MIIDLNRDWTFRKEGEPPVKVTLPHDAMLTEIRSKTAPAGVNNGYFPGGVYLYERVLRVPEEEKDKTFTLHFEGVYRNCTVTVNGEYAGSHAYGYSAFDIDMTALVHTGENRIMVRVDNSLQPNCRWYSGSGIYRPVTLLVREKEYVRELFVRTLSLDPAVIRVETDADEIRILDGEKEVYSGMPGDITVPDAKLWSAEMPHLYTLAAKKGNDERKISFGIRMLSWDEKKGLCVNGQTVKLRGGCIHHDHGVLGACEYRESEERRIRILKENGFNAVRIAHNPASQITLDACDRIGMYVMDEAFDGWYIPKTYHDHARAFEKDHEQVLKEFVESAKNHPSVIMYSLGNEVTETAEEKGIALCQEMRDLVHRLDDSRPVTAGINVLLDVYAKMGLGLYRDKGEYQAEPLEEKAHYKDRKTGSAFFNYWTEKLGKLFFLMSKGKKAEKIVNAIAPSLDIIGLNYASSRYDPDALSHPERLMVGSETMAGDLPYNWERVLKCPQLLGDFVWSAWDYLGETCMGWTYRSYPGLPLISGQGMIDITGLPLAQMAFMQVVWGLRKAPYIAVRPLNHAKDVPDTGAWQFTNALASWSWQGYEGVPAVVEVYANADRVRLLLNGKEVGVKPVKDCKAIFKLPYQPGTLAAEALDENGSRVAGSKLVTGKDETVLSARPEKTEVRPGEVFYVPVEFTDGQGKLKPYVEKRVQVTAENAELLGFGSALTKTDEVFNKPYHDTYRGRALAVLRAGEEGIVRITAESEGYAAGSAEVRIEV